MDDIVNSNQTEEELLSSRNRLRNLTEHLQKTREEERCRISREIHDELGQVLATVQMGVSLLAEDYRDHWLLATRIDEIDQQLRGAIETVQRISAELRPLMLDTLGLAAAVDWQAREFQKKTGIDCTLDIHLHRAEFDPDAATAIFRIFQETLTNIIRHAKATLVRVTLEEKRGKLVLIVRDNGRGITREQCRNSNALGIMGMRERAYTLGGRVTILGAPGKGTVATATIPLPRSGTK